MTFRTWLGLALLAVPLAAFAVAGPTIQSTASTFAVAGVEYSYADMNKAIATGGTLPYTWSLVSGPMTGFSINSSTGVISWLPTDGGDQVISIRVTDAAMLSDTQTFTVHVAAPPTITSTMPSTTASVGRAYQFDADGAMSATSIDGTPTFGKEGSEPASMVVTASTGVVTWVPESAGVYPVKLFAQNAFGKRFLEFNVVVTVDGRAAPVLSLAWNQFAAVGQPYAFSSTRALAVTSGDLPISFSKISGPDNLFVDALTGSIAWIPRAEGTENIKVRATNLAGADEFEFAVTVEDGVTARPTAMATAMPQQGPAMLTVAFSSAGSTGGGNASLLSTEWDFGDGSPPRTDANTTYQYRTAGSRTARLTATNSYGFSATTSLPIVVTQDGIVPPSAKIVTKGPVKGEDRLEVEFDCECTEGSRQIVNILWDFGDGNRSTARAPSHTFLAGGYRVRLVVTDDAGISAEDAVDVAVGRAMREPPAARAYADPPTPNLGDKVSFLATALDLKGQITSLDWDLGDGTKVSGLNRVEHNYTAAGTYEVTFAATADSGLVTTDHLTISVLKDSQLPPQIISVPSLVAYAGVKYRYDDDGKPQARGSREIRWLLADTIAGMDIQRETGEILWTPSANQVGVVTVRLKAANNAAEDTQELKIDVQPADKAPPGDCSYSNVPNATPGVGLLGLVAAGWLANRLTRRRRANPARI